MEIVEDLVDFVNRPAAAAGRTAGAQRRDAAAQSGIMRLASATAPPPSSETHGMRRQVVECAAKRLETRARGVASIGSWG